MLTLNPISLIEEFAIYCKIKKEFKVLELFEQK